MVDVSSLLNNTQEFLTRAAPNMPPQLYWLTVLVFMVLVITAVVDALTSTVPDPLIFFGIAVITGGLGLYNSWPYAAQNLGWALGAGLVIWAINEIWYRVTDGDALGMGDAKWTMLAVACFGLMPNVIAWGIGACLAIVWIVSLRLTRVKITRVYFAPFLFLGLLVGIWWLRFRVS